MEVVGVPYKIFDGEKTVLALEEHRLGLAFEPGERAEIINKDGFPIPVGISENLNGVGYINLLGSGVGKEQAIFDHNEQQMLYIKNLDTKFDIKIRRNNIAFRIDANKIFLRLGDEILFGTNEDDLFAKIVKVVDVYKNPLVQT